ncbi:outer membrane protein assembly factor BamB [Halomonas elongata]|uniref:Outer membrane protein assembly factor BamB n=1 Tax=Halomonas elongata (strain ATCC 33173 / DSM 2581 / NBRC 15536 / NCIMB 2198 / 1H9) TaxID=768066 RepID=E1V6D8_HALED|nr:outer membrane protein assembly factor BamB [Halomonas elongata]MBW5800877.1 outer membrane protein assembly factor BamB [Halomonas elongata]RAW07567.1 outer membrane protein assembly factor BamB [Halomonas elongata]WBF18506.1 outer membrane protein assembly factor BamB [Halomonas elongata]WPU47359.1 outer membrane protein assembly factor BamB [Halomonas elongata DSM 2581]WVI72027.1 outer membrane protein assembly factor BamB [Halomonas elongata]
MKSTLAITAIAALGLLAGCAGQVDSQNPPRELQDISRSTSVNTLWDEQVGDGLGLGGYLLSPAQDGDTLFAADQHGLVMALNANSGEIRWEQKIDNGVSSGLTAMAGHVYLGTRNGEVISLDQSSGKEVWRSRVSSEVLSAPQINSQLVVVQTIDGNVTALDRTSGAERWVHTASRPSLTLRTTGTPRVIDAVTFAGLANGRLVTLENGSGRPLWEQRIATPEGRSDIERLVDLAGQPVLTRDGRLYVTSYSGRLVALQATSGQELWSRDIASYQTPILIGETLYVVDADSHLLALSASSGDELWRLDDLEGRKLTAPAFADGRLVVGDFAGYLHVIDARNGTLVGRTKVDGSGLSVPPLTDGKRVYALADDGSLEALELKP